MKIEKKEADFEVVITMSKKEAKKYKDILQTDGADTWELYEGLDKVLKEQ